MTVGVTIAFIIFVVVVVLVAVVVRIGRELAGSSGRSQLPYKTREYLLSRAERSLYGVLERAVQRAYRIFPKVRLADVLYVERGTERWQSHFNRVSAKHVDFVLCSLDTVSPLLVVELDDASHGRSDRASRDGFVNDALASAGLPILHVRARNSYDVTEVADAIRRAIAAGAEQGQRAAPAGSR